VFLVILYEFLVILHAGFVMEVNQVYSTAFSDYISNIFTKEIIENSF